MPNAKLFAPTSADAPVPTNPSLPRTGRRIGWTILHVIALVLTALALHVAYQIGVLGVGLSMLIIGVALLVLAVTVVRIARGRAYLAWLADPLRSGSRRFVMQFGVRATLWLTAAYAAVLAYPRFATSGPEATLSYVMIWAAAVVLVLCGLAPARRVSRLNLAAAAVAALALAYQLVQLNVPAADPVTLDSPVRGRWVVGSAGRSGLVNHHFTTVQQRDALDIAVPFARSSRRPPTRLADYPAYGQPIYAPAGGVVVRAVGDQPDQAIGSRDPARPVGNHVVVDLGGGRYLLLAHLQPGSLTVTEGESVRAGQALAAVGNSGNSSEPHLHIQLQSGPDLANDQGLPTPGLVTFPMRFDAERTRAGKTSASASDLRTNDLVTFP